MFHPVSFQGERVQKYARGNRLWLYKNNDMKYMNTNHINWTIKIHLRLPPSQLSSSLRRVLLIGAKEEPDDGFIVLPRTVRPGEET